MRNRDTPVSFGSPSHGFSSILTGTLWGTVMDFILSFIPLRSFCMNRKLVWSLLAILPFVLGVPHSGYTQPCQVGDIIQPGGSCTYPGTNDVFSVDTAGKVRFLFFTAGGNLRIRDANINGRHYTLVTELSEGGGRRITELGGPISPPVQPVDEGFTIEIFTTLIPDRNLAAAIRQEIGTSITRRTLQKLTHLEASNRGIRSLKGLEHARNLRFLDIGGEFIDTLGYVNSNSVSDFSPLVGLRYLAYLRTDRNGISDLTTIAGLIHLRYLFLDHNGITNIAPIAGLTELRELSLDNNGITNIVPVAGLTELRYLSLNNNRITNIVPVAGLPELRALHLFNNTISDISPLVALSLIGTKWDSTGLDIRWNPLSSASIETHIPAMRARWIEVVFGNNAPMIASAPRRLGAKLSVLERESLQIQMDRLIASGDRSPAALRALRNFQQLLATARPKKTQLLANYPNPFNPETWIPYELAMDTDVRITIYNSNGVVIRSLLLGHQSAGYYTDRERAAYWDGRNAYGEQVASGVYFYQLETDTVSSMRKMVILK